MIAESFEPGWESDWNVRVWDRREGYASDGSPGLRAFIKAGEHYGIDIKKDLPDPGRHVRWSYDLYFSHDWNPAKHTGKIPGVADLRWKNADGATVGYGNRRPIEEGFSARGWFGPEGRVGLYVYHLDQQMAWGDSIICGRIVPGSKFGRLEAEVHMDAGWIRCRLDEGPWATRAIRVGPETRVDTAWLNVYYGGSKVPETNMFCDIDDFRVENVGEERSVYNPVSFLEYADELEKLSQEMADVAKRMRHFNARNA